MYYVLFYVCKDTTLLRYRQMFSQKSYQKVLVLTFIHINKVVFYRFSQYISNILVLFRYYFILCAIYIYILYTLLYIGRKKHRAASVPGLWVMSSGGGHLVPPSWVVGDEFRRWAPCCLRPGLWVMSSGGGHLVASVPGLWVMSSGGGHLVASVPGSGRIFQPIQTGGASPNPPVWRRSHPRESQSEG